MDYESIDESVTTDADFLKMIVDDWCVGKSKSEIQRATSLLITMTSIIEDDDPQSYVQRTQLVCDQCNSAQVVEEALINVNTNKYVDVSGNAYPFCYDCQNETIKVRQTT